MTAFAQHSSDEPSPRVERPTNIRTAVLMIATAMSVLLYLDRFCVSFAADFIREDLQLTQEQVGYFLSAFFFSYALAQVPAGWLTDRYGARIMLTIYILSWSLFTALIGAVYSFAFLIVTRLACGIGQAGAYPTGASVISKWIPFRKRGVASAWITLGGRAGGAMAPMLTALLIVAFVPVDTPVELNEGDILNVPRLSAKMSPRSVEISSDVERHTSRPTPVGKHIISLISNPADRAALNRASFDFQELESKRLILEPNANTAATRRQLDQVTLELKNLRASAESDAEVRSFLNGLMNSTDKLYDKEAFIAVSLPREAITYLEEVEDGGTLSANELRRLNRLLLEAAFPDDIKKLYSRGWRSVMFVYGAAGIVVALLVWGVFRNRPEEHPRCNAAECELIESGRPADAPSPHGKPGMVPFKRLILSGSMWLDSLGQVGINIGWIFLVTWLPRYLISQHHVPVIERGMMAMIPLLAGIVGIYLGGWLTDLLTHRLGLRWGRSIPMSLTRIAAAGGYALCLWFSTFATNSPFNSPWSYVAAFSFVSFATDLGIPAVWAFKQDVGGRYVGSILGWGNMWGNLGAAVAPPIYNHFLGENPALAEWNQMFVVCMTAYIVAGLFGLGVNATKPIAPPDDETK